MEQPPAVRRSRPPNEPGPRLLPIAFGLALAGFVAGVVGKMLIAHFHHPGKPGAPHATSSPNYAQIAMHGRPTKLAPIPTPQGTWYVEARATPKPSPTVMSAHSPKPAPTFVPTAIPTPAYTATPSAASTTLPTKQPSLKPQPAKHRPVKHILKKYSAVVPVIAIPEVTPLSKPTPDSTVFAPPPVATPQPSASERTVYRYLSSLIRGDEGTAYSLLGTTPGNKDAHLSEESFINSSAHITSVSSDVHTPSNTVHAEIHTAGGSYFTTFHTAERDGRLIIIDHDFIKL